MPLALVYKWSRCQLMKICAVVSTETAAITWHETANTAKLMVKIRRQTQQTLNAPRQYIQQ